MGAVCQAGKLDRFAAFYADGSGGRRNGRTGHGKVECIGGDIRDCKSAVIFLLRRAVYINHVAVGIAVSGESCRGGRAAASERSESFHLPEFRAPSSVVQLDICNPKFPDRPRSAWPW